jgi:hypothetical protein
MADRFDVVAIRIEDEGPKVGLMVLGAKTGTTVVAPDRRYGRLVESPHCRTVVGDEGSGICSATLLWKLLAGHLGKRAPKDLTVP